MAGALSGRVALITGASAGIGEAGALALAAEGATVAVAARRRDRLEALVKRIEAAGGKALVQAGDVAVAEDATRMVADTIRQCGRLDILVNNAGINQAGGIENCNFDEYKQMLDVNLMSAVYTCQAAIPTMRKQGSGDIINISSTAARRTGPVFNGYCASKFGLWAMTEGMRQEIAKYGIRVCNIEPGYTSTEISESVSDPQLKEFMRNHINQEGAMKPQDVADAIIFVVSLPPRANIPEMQIRPTKDDGRL